MKKYIITEDYEGNLLRYADGTRCVMHGDTIEELIADVFKKGSLSIESTTRSDQYMYMHLVLPAFNTSGNLIHVEVRDGNWGEQILHVHTLVVRYVYDLNNRFVKAVKSYVRLLDVDVS